MVSKLRVLLLVVPIVLFGQIAARAQRSDTVYQTLASSYSASPTPTFNITNNIGQAAHAVYFSLSNNGIQTCAGFNNLYGGLQYSFDNVTFFSFGTPTSASSNNNLQNGTGVYLANGPFPFLRFVVTQFNNAKCVLSAFYVGSIQAQVVYANGFVRPNSSLVDANRNYVGYPTFLGGLGDNALFSPVVICDKSASRTITSGTTQSLASIAAFIATYTQTAYVCSIAVTTSGTGTLQLGLYNDSAGCGTTLGLNFTPALNIISSAPFQLGHGMGFISKVTIPTNASPTFVDLCGVATGADMQVMVTYAVVPATI